MTDDRKESLCNLEIFRKAYKEKGFDPVTGWSPKEKPFDVLNSLSKRTNKDEKVSTDCPAGPAGSL